MQIVYLIAAIIWGAVSAQFLVQIISSFVTATIFLYGLFFSRVNRRITGPGFVAAIAQVVLFGVLFVGGFWLIVSFTQAQFSQWNMNWIAGLVAFLISFTYCIIQVPAKIYVARSCAMIPLFAEIASSVAPNRALTMNEARRLVDKMTKKPKD